jgi:hypothetical protein
MLRPRRGLALGLPLFPLRHRYLHQLGSTSPGAGGERGKMGFLIGGEANFHAIQRSSAGRCVNIRPRSPIDLVAARTKQRCDWQSIAQCQADHLV